MKESAKNKNLRGTGGGEKKILGGNWGEDRGRGGGGGKGEILGDKGLRGERGERISTGKGGKKISAWEGLRGERI